MRTIVKQSLRKLREVQQADKGKNICISHGKMKPGNIDEQLGDMRFESLQVCQSLQKRSPALLSNFKKNLSKNDEFLQSIITACAQEDLDDHPFYQQGLSFMDYVEMEILQIKKAQKMMEQLHLEIQQLSTSILAMEKPNDPEKTQKEFDLTTKKNQSLFQFTTSAIKADDQNLIKLLQQQRQCAEILNKILEEQKSCQQEIKTISEKLQVKSNQFQQKSILWEKAKNNLLINTFQTAIIKLQRGSTLYRYGAKVMKSDVSKIEYFDQKCFKFEYKVKPIDMFDLKLFALTTLYPMSMSIFQDFSASSSIFKVMFGLEKCLTQEQIDSSTVMLNKRMEKYLVEKRFNTLEQCLNSAINSRSKKIIFIGSKENFNEFVNQLISELNGFSSNIIAIANVSFQQVSNSYEGTNFTHYQLHISFLYNSVSIKSTIDTLYCAPHFVSKQQIQELRKNSSKTDSVLGWFEIPKAEFDQQRIYTYKEINSILSKCKRFHV